MVHCATCNAEIPVSGKSCPACGSAPPLSNGTQATVAIDLAPIRPASTTSSRLSDISAVDDGRFLPGTLVNGRYRIVGLLGRGGMGEVYRATDLTLAQPVALKFLPDIGVTERVLERFHAEVRTARQVSHPNICRVYDIGEVDGQPFISMEYVDGEDLGGLLQRIGRLPNDKALDTARKICAGLAAAHDRGIIHRDLKPANIMLNKRGEPVIMDFGLAAVADQLTGAEARNGTPAYMSPEQLRGQEVTPKSDIYALGLVLYEIFTGKRAYEAKSEEELIRMQESAQVTSLTSIAQDIDPQVEKVIRRCLMPDPMKRPAGALAVAAALPGGDPLAAALAAGETPSPEMVAAAGKTEGLELKYSIPLMLFICAVLFYSPFYFIQNNAIENTPVSFSPEVLSHEARKIAASFGYTQAPADSTGGLDSFSAARDYWKSHDRKGKSLAELNAAEPFFSFYYRESPNPLVSSPDGNVEFTNPPFNVAGMIEIELTPSGQLRVFDAIPPEKAPVSAVPPAAAAEVDEGALFQMIGYDLEEFSEAAPERIPLVPFDVRKAWRGPAPGLPGVEVRVEAASLNGKLSSLRVMFPWSNTQREPDKPPSRSDVYGFLANSASFGMASLVCLIFSIRNLRLNRADRKGAARLAVVGGALNFAGWFGSAHHVIHFAEWNHLIYAVSDSIASGFVLWLIYTAIEPAVRARWPHSLITWNRLLNGKFADAQIGAHVLAGAAAGGVIILGFFAYEQIDGRTSGNLQFNDLASLTSPMLWFGMRAAALGGAIRTGFVVFFAIFGFRSLLRNDYLATLATAISFTVFEGQGIWTNPNPWLSGALYLFIFGLLAFVLIRMGMLSTFAAIVFINSMGKITLGPGLHNWYTPYGFATMAFLLSIAIFAFWRSIGSRSLDDSNS